MHTHGLLTKNHVSGRALKATTPTCDEREVVPSPTHSSRAPVSGTGCLSTLQWRQIQPYT